MLRTRACLLSFLACGYFSSEARADFHIMRISEVLAQYGGDPRLQFVELVMLDVGQNILSGHPVIFQDASGRETGRVAFTSNVPNGITGRNVLIGTQAFATAFNVTPDLIIPEGLMSPYSGRVCFETVDCVAYGDFTGSNTGYGTPAPGFPVNGTASLTLRISDPPFPKHNGADFIFAAPTPENNAAAEGVAPAAPPCFVTDDFADLSQWDVPAAGEGLDLTNCGAPIVVDLGSAAVAGGKLLLTPSETPVPELDLPLGITGLSVEAAAMITDPSYRLRLVMEAEPGIAVGAVFVKERYFFDTVEETIDVGETAGFGINFSFDNTGEISDHLHADVRTACFGSLDVEGQDDVDYPGFTLMSAVEYVLILDVDGDTESGPLTLQVKLFDATEPEPADYLVDFYLPGGLGTLSDEDIVHEVLIASIGASTSALQISDFSVCDIPRNQQHVRRLVCARQETGEILVTWLNPFDAENEEIDIIVNGTKVDSVPATETSYTLVDPPDGDAVISVLNYSGVPATCTVCGNNPPEPIIDGPTTVPAPGLVSLDSSNSTDGDDGTQTLARLWEIIDAPDGASASIGDPAAVEVMINVNALGEYRVRLTLTDGGCPGSPPAVNTAEHIFTVGTAGGMMLPGDENEDGKLDISDPVALLNHLFLGTNPTLPCGDGSTAHPSNVMLLDLNGDGRIDISDPVFGLNFLFAGGPNPVPGTACISIAECPNLCDP